MSRLAALMFVGCCSCMSVFDNNPDYVLEPSLQVWEGGRTTYGPGVVEMTLRLTSQALVPITDWSSGPMEDWLFGGSVKLTFVPDKFECWHEAKQTLCGGYTRSDVYGNYWPQVWAADCIADSALVHEISHVLMWKYLGWPDYSHTTKEVWVDIETQLTDKLREELCRNE